MPELPAMLYKPGSGFEWDGEMFDYLVVSTDKELAAAQAEGWVAHKPIRDPLDHDGDGKAGGSLKGEQSTVARGRRKKAEV